MRRSLRRVRRTSRLGIAAAGLIVAACTSEAAPPNIVLIYADDLGWRDLGVQGSTYYETPHIDRLAAEGLRFTNAYANAPNCAPSRAALMSGQYAPRTGIYTVQSAARGRAEDRLLVPVENRTELALEIPTLAEALQDAGYRTGHIGKWHLGGAGYAPSDQGFDWTLAGDARGGVTTHFFPYGRGDAVPPGLESGDDGEYLADRITDHAIEFIEAAGERPFFLYLSHYSVHTPIQGRPDLVEHYRDKPASDGHGNPEYAAMIQAVDEGVGRVLETLDRLAIAENTVVIFYSDNGGFGPVTTMSPLRGSKGMLYEGGIREPLIIRWPGRIAEGVLTDVPVIGTDFYPTLVELAAGSTPVGHQLDGRSFAHILRDVGAASPSRDIFWHFPAYLGADASVTGPWRTTPASAIRRDRWKLIHFFEGNRWELYDLESDIGESDDLSALMPERTAELRGALEAWWAETGAFLPTPKSD
jgi:arylsulfatase A-like enzyme